MERAASVTYLIFILCILWNIFFMSIILYFFVCVSLPLFLYVDMFQWCACPQSLATCPLSPSTLSTLWPGCPVLGLLPTPTSQFRTSGTLLLFSPMLSFSDPSSVAAELSAFLFLSFSCSCWVSAFLFRSFSCSCWVSAFLSAGYVVKAKYCTIAVIQSRIV